MPLNWQAVQIAALRLDRAQASRVWPSLVDREDLFLLPPGTLINGLSPVCVGVYASANDAKRAATSMVPFPGSSSRPFCRRLDSLTGPP